jgi:hypothetical protein
VTRRALDYIKRGVDAVIERGNNGAGLARDEAGLLRRRLREVLSVYDELVPEYGAARQAIVDAAREASTTDAPRIVRELEAVAFSDIGQVFTPSPAGALQLKPLVEWSESTRRAVSSIKVRAGLDRDGDPVTVTELRFWPKLDALKQLREQLGMANAEGPPPTEIVVRVVRE